MKDDDLEIKQLFCNVLLSTNKYISEGFFISGKALIAEIKNIKDCEKNESIQLANKFIEK